AVRGLCHTRSYPRARLPLSARREDHVFRRPYFTKDHAEYLFASILWTGSVGGVSAIAAGDVGARDHTVAALARTDARGSLETHPRITPAPRSPASELC